MCTVSVARGADEHAPCFRVVSNRDELRSRVEAEPPRVIEDTQARILMPVDPQSGGTWIGVNDRGIVAVLLNSNPSGGVTSAMLAGRESRGGLVPKVLDSTSFDAACACASKLEARRYAPFRLLLLGLASWVHWHGTGERLWRVESSPMDKPVCFASSGLGDDRVQQPRLALFDSMIHTNGVYDFEVQDRFHHAPMPQSPELGVMMSRADARTVSVTSVKVDAANHRAVMIYESIRDMAQQPVSAVTVALSLRREDGA